MVVLFGDMKCLFYSFFRTGLPSICSSSGSIDILLFLVRRLQYKLETKLTRQHGSKGELYYKHPNVFLSAQLWSLKRLRTDLIYDFKSVALLWLEYSCGSKVKRSFLLIIVSHLLLSFALVLQYVY
jgi:hypothetical protein